MIDYIKFSPIVISTTIKHYLNGPPRPSWDLKYHLTWAIFRSHFSPTVSNAKTIEQMQQESFRPSPLPAGVMINEFKINNKHRYEAQVHLEKILKPYEHVLDTEWKDLKDDGIVAEWVQVPNDGWEKKEIRKTILLLHGGGYYLGNKESHHIITGPLAEKANARVLGKPKLVRMILSINFKYISN
jgi:acetyl esterase/lipase